ncbi:hypothetical protein ACU8KH_01029 [Lachancea thermotolerans]
MFTWSGNCDYGATAFAGPLRVLIYPALSRPSIKWNASFCKGLAPVIAYRLCNQSLEACQLDPAIEKHYKELTHLYSVNVAGRNTFSSISSN